MDRTFKPGTFMLVPTMACNASCKYCFAQKQGERMRPVVIEKTLDFIERVAPAGERVKIIFHGGEPLLGGAEFYHYILPRLRERFGRRLKLSIQSNLWAIDEELIELFRCYDVNVGTSLDGYREMCDSQRGEGYYDKTAQAMEFLEKHGVHAGKICTIGAPNADKAAEVFAQADGNYSLHGAVRSLGCEPGEMTLTAEQMKQVLLDSYRAYRKDPDHARISTIDQMAEGCLKGKSPLCTFYACLGHYASIAPDGAVYSCNRFCGHTEFCLGNVMDDLTEEDILNSPVYRKLSEKQDGMKNACGDCPHFPYCSGGCLYSSFAADTDKDPFCEAYKAVFEVIQRDLAAEMGAILTGQEAATPTLSMAGETKHPYTEKTQKTYWRNILSADKLGRSGSRLLAHPENKLHQVFLNLTYRCPLHCTHCSASADADQSAELPIDTIVSVAEDAIDAHFRIVTLTGGEPLVYSRFLELLERLGKVDRKGTGFQLRTSLGIPLDDGVLNAAGSFFDRITVSVDGDRQTHDARRGEGRYDITVQNLQRFASLGFAKKIYLCAVLTAEQQQSAVWTSVKELGSSIGVRSVYCRPLLPMGRNCRSDCTENFLLPENGLSRQCRISCGLGMNLHIEPTGRVFPCYACTGTENLLGNVMEEPLSAILATGKLLTYQQHTVDTNEKCQTCDVRYLCGGICRAWLKNDLKLDSGDFDCVERQVYLRKMAKEILKD